MFHGRVWIPITYIRGIWEKSLPFSPRRRRAGETLAWIGQLSYVPTAEEVSWKLQSSSVASFFRAL